MSIGQLRDFVTFEKRTKTPDGGGGNTVGWVTAHETFGKFRPERGSERLAAGRIEASVAGTLTVRSYPETQLITTSHRVQIDGVAYQIRSIINPDQRNRFLEMTVERGVGQ